uniref:Putative syntaxin-4 n=2 Tax=Caenorhabditis elegans TaxID=6239 RepID=STX4_CAEEL|nr:RecName: Full=Putative syntaxin-4 [Caenorhabditis elegans]
MHQISGINAASPEKNNSKLADVSLQQFLANVDEIRHVLTTLSADRHAIYMEQVESLAAGCSDTAKCRKLNDHVDKFIAQARGIRRRLADASEELVQYPESRVGSGRARHEQIQMLIVSLEGIMSQFADDQASYKAEAAKKIAAYLRKQNIEVTDSEIDGAIENGSLFQLTRNINLGVAQKKALFDDMKNRATDIMILEKQIREVEELFVDMQLLVQSQGETVDRIETSVIRAEEYAEQAQQNVRQAVVLRRKNRKWKIVTCIALIVLLLVVVYLLSHFLGAIIPGWK